jgi:hypothetical protein
MITHHGASADTLAALSMENIEDKNNKRCFTNPRRCS